MKNGPHRIKLVELIKTFGRLIIVRFTEEEKSSLRRIAASGSRHRTLMWLVVITGAIAAIFEGGTIGILGFSVSILIDDPIVPLDEIPGPLGTYLFELSEKISREGLFLFFVGLAIGAQIIKSVVVYCSQIAQTYLSVEMRRDLSKQVTDHIMSLSYSEVTKLPPGTLVSVINLSAVIDDVVSFVSELARSILMLVVFTIILIALSPLLTAIVVLIVLILWRAMKRVIDRLRNLSTKATEKNLSLGRWTVEYLNTPKMLRIFNATEQAGKSINSSRDELIFAERDQDVIVAAIKPIIELIAILGAGMVLIFGYVLASGGASSAIPVLFVNVLVIYRLKPNIAIFNDVRIKIARLLPKMCVVDKFLLIPLAVKNISNMIQFHSLNDKIVFSGVGFRYPESEVDVISEVTFSIEKAEMVALVGASGAGKTTIIDLLLGLYEPELGVITIDGRDLREVDICSWRRHIGVVDQDVHLLNTTVNENIRFARLDATNEMIEAAARTAHAHEFIERLGDGYNTVIGDRGYRLSGGQKQRLALARAILMGPDLLVLDEATSALDSISERLIQQAIEEMHNACTVIIVAHRLSTIENADKIVVLDKGRIIEQGSKTSLIEQGGAFRRLWDLQRGSSVILD